MLHVIDKPFVAFKAKKKNVWRAAWFCLSRLHMYAGTTPSDLHARTDRNWDDIGRYQDDLKHERFH